MQALDCDLALEFRIDSPVYFSHSSAAEFLLDTVMRDRLTNHLALLRKIRVAFAVYINAALTRYAIGKRLGNRAWKSFVA